MNFYIDGRTGLVRKVYEPYEDPETARLRNKHAAKQKARARIAKRSRRRNRK